MKSKLFIQIFLFILLVNLSSALSVDFFASSPYSSYSQCSCSNVISKVNVINTADFDANFFVNFEGDLKDYASLSPTFLHLKPKEKGHFLVFVNLPCNWYGDKKLKIIISSDLNVKKEIVLNYNILKCSDLNVSLKRFTNESCKCSLFSYQVLMKNLGKYDESYALNVKGIKNATYPKSVNINSNESKLVDITLKPNCYLNQRKAVLEIKSNYTQQEQSLSLPININKSCSTNKISSLDWIITGIVGFIIILIIILILRSKKYDVQERPKVVKLRIDQKKKWPSIVFAILFIILIGAVAYFGYVYVPKLFLNNINESNNNVTPVNSTVNIFKNVNFLGGFTLYIVIGVILLVIMLLIIWLSKSEKGSFWKFLFKLFFTLIITGIILCLAWLIWAYFALILAFVKMYLIYIVIGLALLIILIIVLSVSNKTSNYEDYEETKKYVCEFCGKEYKTEKGLNAHKKKVHNV